MVCADLLIASLLASLCLSRICNVRAGRHQTLLWRSTGRIVSEVQRKAQGALWNYSEQVRCVHLNECMSLCLSVCLSVFENKAREFLSISHEPNEW